MDNYWHRKLTGSQIFAILRVFLLCQKKSKKFFNAMFVIPLVLASLWWVFIKFRWLDEMLTSDVILRIFLNQISADLYQKSICYVIFIFSNFCPFRKKIGFISLIKQIQFYLMRFDEFLNSNFSRLIWFPFPVKLQVHYRFLRSPIWYVETGWYWNDWHHRDWFWTQWYQTHWLCYTRSSWR